MLRCIALTVMLTASGAASTWAEDIVQPINPSVPMFCKDDHKFQPFSRTDLQRLSEGFKRQFGWSYTLHSTGSSIGYLLFSDNGKPEDADRITYDVEPYNGGIALLHMHARVKGKAENVSGTAMCWRTFEIVNGQ